MDYPLDGCWTKTAWAAEHLQQLDDEIRAWLRENGNRRSRHFYAEANLHVFWSELPYPPLLRWGVMIGNAIHCFRSALDHLIWQLVLSNGKTPRSGPGGNQFPIFRDRPASFASATKGTLRGVHDDHRAMIEGLQPYARTDDVPVVDNPLVLLKQLSNTDKHQIVHAVVFHRTNPEKWTGSFGGNDDAGPITWLWIGTDGVLTRGAVLACFEAVPTGPNPEVDMEFSFRLDVAFEGGRSIVQALNDVTVSTQSILNYFIPAFGSWEGSAFYGS